MSAISDPEESPAATVADLVRRRAGDDHPALLFDDERWTYRELVQACFERAALLRDERRPGPFHVGVLLENVPEFPLLLGAAAVAGATVVGVNPTRRGDELARDLRHTEVQVLITEERFVADVAAIDHGLATDQVHVIDAPSWTAALRVHHGAPDPEVEIDPDAPYLLIFTSGTTGAPKAAIVSQRRLAGIGERAGQSLGLGPGKVAYLAMPLFHSNALFAGWAPALARGAACALRRRFSASGFLPDVRRHGATYFNYVGKPLSYLLATPELPDDAENPLELVLGNEAAVPDIRRFAERFGCYVVDNYGSTEGAIAIVRTPETPSTALGEARGEGVCVLDPDTGDECPPAEFDTAGTLVNSDDAVGEIASRTGAGGFEGYWKNPEADRQRTRDGIFWSGDLGFRDAEGWFYFAGRADDWLRVDGENLATAPIEQILQRDSGVTLAAVFAVPNENVGDDVMAALVLHPDRVFEPAAFEAFLADQRDLHRKATPRYVRVATALPMTPSNKVLVRQLRDERWECDDPVWISSPSGYRLLDEFGREAIRERFRTRGREQVLG